MKKICSLLCSALTLAAFSGDIIPQRNYDFNELYPLRKVAGRYGWLTGIDVQNPGQIIMFQLGLSDELAMFSVEPDGNQNSNLKGQEYLKRRLELFQKGKLPLSAPNRPFYLDNNIQPPSQKKIEAIAQFDNFLGWRPFNEWGTGFIRMLSAATSQSKVNTTAGKKQAERGKELFKDFKLPVTSREEFEQAARFAWNQINGPFNFETYVLDGSHYWAKAWPGGWNKIRAIITENRVPYRSNVIMQAITRGAARMWGVPFGYLSAYDWYARISSPIYDHMQKPRLNYQNQQGILKINPNLYRRIWYYEIMGNAAIIADESDHARFSDPGANGQYRFNWYGELCEEIRDFVKNNPNLGVSYNPIALGLSWHNGVVYKGDKAFGLFDYNYGEHMSRELLHRVIYQYSEKKEHMDELGPTPYGDIFDVLRLDTPRGPLPEKLLENYKVLFLVGEQNFTSEMIKSLEEYVKKGGTLIINSAQLKGQMKADFLGVDISGNPGKTDTIISEVNGKVLKSGKFTYSALKPLPDTVTLYKVANGPPLVTRKQYGKGFVICIGAHWMLEDKSFIEDNYVRRTMIPLAGDLLQNILSSLLPFRIEGKDVEKQILYQVNRKGRGWVVSLYNNDGRSNSSKAYHGYMGPDIENINKTINLRLSVDPSLKFATELLNHERCYFSGTQGKQYLEFTLAPGNIKIVELLPEPIADPVITEKVNLALNKTVTASSFTPGYEPEKAIDGNCDFTAAWWSSDSCPQWLTVDLGKVETINSIHTVVAWSEDNNIFPRISQYTVEASEDAQNWKTVVNESKNIQPDTKRGLHRYFEPLQARYLKLNLTFNSSRQGAQVVEFKVYGEATHQVTIPWKTDPSKALFPPETTKMRTKTCLSDRSVEMISAKQDEKSLAYDKECYSGNPLKIRGRQFKKGLGSHAKSEIIYRLEPKDNWKLFTAYVGIDDNSAPVGSVEFLVYVDNKIAARTGKLTMKNHAVPIWADIKNAKELKLVIDDCNDGINGDIADWADACLRK